jgi:tetratricopeptide (TPR) repeat protein
MPIIKSVQVLGTNKKTGQWIIKDMFLYVLPAPENDDYGKGFFSGAICAGLSRTNAHYKEKVRTDFQEWTDFKNKNRNLCSVNLEAEKNILDWLKSSEIKITMKLRLLLMSYANKVVATTEELLKTKVEKPQKDINEVLMYWNDKGIELKNNGRSTEAIRIYDLVLSRNPREDIKMAALMNKAIALKHLKRFNAAIKIYDLILKKDLNNFVALANKASALNQAGKSREALKYYDKALKIGTNDVISDDRKKLLEYLKKPKTKGKKSISELLQEGFELENEGKYNKAIKIFSQIIHTKKAPENELSGAIEGNFVALTNKGIDLLDEKKYLAAMKCFEEASKLGIDEVDCLINKGIAYEKLKRYDKAIECYDAILKIDPKDFAALNNKGYALYLLKKYDEALNCFNKALEIEPEFIFALGNRDAVLSEMKTKKKAPLAEGAF